MFALGSRYILFAGDCIRFWDIFCGNDKNDKVVAGYEGISGPW